MWRSADSTIWTSWSRWWSESPANSSAGGSVISAASKGAFGSATPLAYTRRQRPSHQSLGAQTADLVRFERQQRVAWITIDHPPANALSGAVLDGLRSALAEVEADVTLGAAVLIGAGDRFFVAGADIGEFLSQGPDGTRAKIADGQQLTLEMERHR